MTSKTVSAVVAARIPRDYPVQPASRAQRFAPSAKGTTFAQCGNCGLWWNDDAVTSLTPTPAARCPFEPFHHHAEE